MKKEIEEKCNKIKNYLEESKCSDVVIVDLPTCTWTEAFVIATVTSTGHLKGVSKNIWDLLKCLSLSVNNRHKSPSDDGWELIDCGDLVIHLMSKELREFYDLEKLWRKVESL